MGVDKLIHYLIPSPWSSWLSSWLVGLDEVAWTDRDATHSNYKN